MRRHRPAWRWLPDAPRISFRRFSPTAVRTPSANPSSIELLQTKSIALAAGSHWREAATTLSQVAEVDSANIDSLFAVRITNYLRSVPDSASVLNWLRIVTTRLPIARTT